MASLMGLVAFVTACSPNKKQGLELLTDYQGIISTQPQPGTHALFLIKLTEKAGLASGGKADPKQLALIDAEQAKLMKELTALSTDIKPLYKYRLVANGVAVVAPVALKDRLKSMTNVVYVESAGNFSRPMEIPNALKGSDFTARNSVKFIGGDLAHSQGLRGQGVRVGIIDTGIDYTHSMFGGAGTEEAYKAVNPAQMDSSFPSAKVVGGVDFAGTEYNSASADFTKRIPIPDANPLDEQGHGTHVGGTVAGLGDGGVTSYDGVAPDAVLYAIKVFGKDGSTGDATVLAALEYSADPNGDGDTSDHLDVVNLSLGGGFGEAHILYSEGVSNLTAGGTVVVASAGNSGDVGYIVGAPSVAEDAVSVAASVDDMDHNWKFAAVKFSVVGQPDILTEAIEGTVGKSIATIGDVQGPLVYVGLANEDFSAEVKASVQGKVALIDRGVVEFGQKVKRAFEAGAIGVVVANNQPGEPLAMGGDEIAIPAIMVKQELGATLKAAAQKGEARIQFKTEERIDKPELIDTITGFSSRGPRSFDALIKPEIAAPGAQTVSAKMGGGKAVVPMSGTSMAAPHMSGVMALLKQARPQLSAADYKSLVMSTAKPMVTATKLPYSISRQGAGRVQIMAALGGQVTTVPQSLSLGELSVETAKTIQKTLQVRNVTDKELDLNIAFDTTKAVRMVGPANVKLAKDERKEITLRFTVDASSLTDLSTEFDGNIRLLQGSTELAHVPVLAVVNKVSQMKAASVVVRSTSDADSQGSVVDVTLTNSGVHGGDAYLFNFLGADRRKIDATQDAFRSKACDLAGAGYRVVSNKDGERVLQIAVKVYEPMTAWNLCEVSVLIDADGDGVADQELAGITQENLKGLSAKTFASVLIDAPAARELRKKFEADTRAANAAPKPSPTPAPNPGAEKPGDKKKDAKDDLKEDYTSTVQALSPMQNFDRSTIAIVEAPIAKLKRRGTGELAVRIATSYQEGSALEQDDYLVKDSSDWTSLNLAPGGAGFGDLPEKVSLLAGKSQTLSITKGAGSEPLWILYPSNKPVVGGVGGAHAADRQSQIAKPKYEALRP